MHYKKLLKNKGLPVAHFSNFFASFANIQKKLE